MLQNIGVFGLGVMGASMAKNIERNGFPTVIYNYTYDLTEKFMSRAEEGNNFTPARTVFEFVNELQRPRRILIMVTAGKAVDAVIEQLMPFLEPGDILIDGGNSHYMDTDRRNDKLSGSGIQYIGMGVSGGEQGALKGPSMMPGGDEGTYHYIEPVLNKIAAKAGDEEPCVTYIGKGSAGHFVKMVHNGIEYGDMQLIAESYDILRHGLRMSPDEIAEVFTDWNKGRLSSYLIEITAKIVNFPDDQREGVLLDNILDKAGMKGTGTWTGQAALTYCEPIPTIIAALHGRALSSLTEERNKAQKLYDKDVKIIPGDKKQWVDKVATAMYASKICSYAQGFALMQMASREKGYKLQLDKIASIWRGGCIIRADFLEKIREAFKNDPDCVNLLVEDSFAAEIKDCVDSWREVVGATVLAGIAIPAMTASLAYFEALRRDKLPANIIQAQRDFFGAHTYKRKDLPGTFHTQWEGTN